MSHELRTPLNSLLILAEQLEDNQGDTMTDTQVGYASVIHSSGKDLLELLNSILDLAKVESGTVTITPAHVPLAELGEALLREFEHVASGKSLDYSVEVAPGTPDTIVTDPQRLRQITRLEYLRESGTEGIELIMWLIMRAALGKDVEELHRFYHVPASNTAVGHIILENRKRAAGKRPAVGKIAKIAKIAKIKRAAARSKAEIRRG